MWVFTSLVVPSPFFAYFHPRSRLHMIYFVSSHLRHALFNFRDLSSNENFPAVGGGGGGKSDKRFIGRKCLINFRQRKRVYGIISVSCAFAENILILCLPFFPLSRMLCDTFHGKHNRDVHEVWLFFVGGNFVISDNVFVSSISIMKLDNFMFLNRQSRQILRFYWFCTTFSSYMQK